MTTPRHKPRPVSGFPEWLPEAQLVEARWIDHVRTTFESYGFTPIRTPSVEEIDVLMSKGETSQEVYTLRRFQADEGDGSDARLGLHFDLTVPLARYVAQHFAELDFPFKRYQIQPVWRGERPQEGRFREFIQCDIDVIGVDSLSGTFDAELPRIAVEILLELGIGAFELGINHRKLLEGYYRGLGIDDPLAAIRAADKLDKVGSEGVAAQLSEELDLAPEQVSGVLALAEIKGDAATLTARIGALGVSHPLLDEGLAELLSVLAALEDLPSGLIVADLSIARGLDYYTGIVYEGRFRSFPGYGSICSGGRYQDLASAFTARRLPGVGISLGLTRIFAKLLNEGLIELPARTPTVVLVTRGSEDDAALAASTARTLRKAGIPTEVYHEPANLSKQLRYASRKAIPFVWFPPMGQREVHEVKDMASGAQVVADPERWSPPDARNPAAADRPASSPG